MRSQRKSHGSLEWKFRMLEYSAFTCRKWQLHPHRSATKVVKFQLTNRNLHAKPWVFLLNVAICVLYLIPIVSDINFFKSAVSSTALWVALGGVRIHYTSTIKSESCCGHHSCNFQQISPSDHFSSPGCLPWVVLIEALAQVENITCSIDSDWRPAF